MNRKLLSMIASALLGLGIVCSASGCGKKAEETAATSVSEEAGQVQTAPRIAYVRLDSLYAQYQYYQDITAELTKEAEANRKQLTSKANALRKAAEDFDRKRRTNAFLSQSSMEAEQMKLVSLQEQGEKLEVRLTQEFMLKQQQSNEKLRERIKADLAKYNKDKKYQFILTNVGVESMLYADSSCDITDEVVKYLNSSYKKDK